MDNKIEAVMEFVEFMGNVFFWSVISILVVASSPVWIPFLVVFIALKWIGVIQSPP